MIGKFVGLVLLFASASLAADPLVFINVNVIDLATGGIQEGQVTVTGDGRIKHVRPAGLDLPENATLIDGKGGYLIPGLAEMHAHVPSRGRGDQYTQDVLALFLANGVTTIRGMLGEAWHLELRQRLADGAWEGPRLVTSGPSFNGRSVNSPDQAVDRVREQAAAGYDFLKIHPGLNRAEFDALARAANELGIPFAGHVSFEVGVQAALDAGQASIDHLDSYAQAMLPPDSGLTGEAPQWFGLNLGAGLDPGLAAGLARDTAAAGVWNVPTQSLFETTAGTDGITELMARDGMQYLSDGLAGRWRQSVEDLRAQAPDEYRLGFLNARRALIAALQESGAGLLLGSDAPQIMNVPGFSVHQELGYLVAAGLTPLQALQAGTLNVARYFQFPDQGQVASGYVADLVLLRQNPLANISNTKSIAGVMRAGRWYDRSALDRILQGVEKRGL